MKPFQDRKEAGRVLAKALAAYANQPNLLVLALPRGGVPVAYEIAKSLHAKLDVFIVRKLGFPNHPEFAMGAIAEGGYTYLNQTLIQEAHLTQASVDAVKSAEMIEMQRRQRQYRGNRPFPEIEGKTVILVDDGVATGASLRVAIEAIRAFHPAVMTVAVPVADPEVIEDLAREVDAFICPLQPSPLNAVGAWYAHFPAVEDEEVRDCLSKIAYP